MNAFPANTAGFEFDVAPALKFYMQGLESWKDNCQRMLQPFPIDPAANANSPAPLLAHALPAGEAMFVQFVDRQVALCRFFADRWEQYRSLPERLSRCRTAAEFGEAQLDFLNRMASDYAQQGARLAQPIQGG